MTSTVTQPVSSTPQLSNDPTGSETISQSLVTPVQTEPTSPVVSVPTLPATVIVAQPVLSTPESSVEPIAVVSQPIVAIPTTTTTDPITTLINSGTVTSTAINPQLPQATVDTSMPTTSVTVRVGPHGDYTDLQTALNNVSLGTTILLEPGVSYTTSNELGFVLPNKTTGTDGLSSVLTLPIPTLPAPGTMTYLSRFGDDAKNHQRRCKHLCDVRAPGAHNYRIIGVEFMNQGNVDTRSEWSICKPRWKRKQCLCAKQSYYFGSLLYPWSLCTGVNWREIWGDLRRAISGSHRLHD